MVKIDKKNNGRTGTSDKEDDEIEPADGDMNAIEDELGDEDEEDLDSWDLESDMEE